MQSHKLMFIRSILVMDDNSLSKKIFCERAIVYFTNDLTGTENTSNSMVFYLLNVSSTFGLLDEIRGMIENQHFYTKSVWREMVWKKDWVLEELYWRIEKHMHRSLDILSGISPVVRYLPWWSSILTS